MEAEPVAEMGADAPGDEVDSPAFRRGAVPPGRRETDG
jgi:hypothetical protein